MRIGAQVGIITAVCFTLTTVVPAGAAAKPEDKRKQAKSFFDAGKRFYEMKNWQAAIDQFKQAAKILPSPILDYNIGICYEKLGDPRMAVSYYQRYLTGAPKADNRAEVEEKIKTLNAQAAATPPPAPPPGAPPAAPLPGDEEIPPAPPPPPGGYYDYGMPPPGAAPPPPVAEVEPRPITSRWWFWALIGAGVLVLVAAMVAASNQNAYDASPGTLQLRQPGAHRAAPRQLQPPQPRGLLQPMQPAQPRGVMLRF